MAIINVVGGTNVISDNVLVAANKNKIFTDGNGTFNSWTLENNTLTKDISAVVASGYSMKQVCFSSDNTYVVLLRNGGATILKWNIDRYETFRTITNVPYNTRVALLADDCSKIAAIYIAKADINHFVFEIRIYNWNGSSYVEDSTKLLSLTAVTSGSNNSSGLYNVGVSKNGKAVSAVGYTLNGSGDISTSFYAKYDETTGKYAGSSGNYIDIESGSFVDKIVVSDNGQLVSSYRKNPTLPYRGKTVQVDSSNYQILTSFDAASDFFADNSYMLYSDLSGTSAKRLRLIQYKLLYSNGLYAIDRSSYDELKHDVVSNSFEYVMKYVNDGKSVVAITRYSSDALFPPYIYNKALTNLTPGGGFVDYTQDIIFGWNLVSDMPVTMPVVQASAQVRYRIAGETAYTSINISGATNTATLPANTLAINNNYEWQLYAVLADGTNITSDWIQINTNDAISDAVIVFPKNAYLDFSFPIEFSWEHVIDTGTAPTGADLQYKQLANDWTQFWTITDAPDTTAIIPGDTLPGGDMQWRVRTYNSAGVAGNWSDAVNLVGVGTPPTPVITAVTNMARPTVSWQSLGQRAYQLQIEGPNGIIYDTNEVSGTAKTHKVTDFLSDGEYIALLRIKNSSQLWSRVAQYSFVLSTIKPEIGDFGVQVQENYNIISLLNPPASFYRAAVYRNGVPVGLVSLADSFYDYAAKAGTTDYFVRFFGNDDSFADTPVQSVISVVDKIALSVVDSLDKFVKISGHPAGGPDLSVSNSIVGVAQHYAGRALPVYSFSEFVDREISLQYFYFNRVDYDKLYAVFMRNRTVLYRDCKGNKCYAAMTSLSSTENNNIYEFEIALLPVDYVEGVEL